MFEGQKVSSDGQINPARCSATQKSRFEEEDIT